MFIFGHTGITLGAAVLLNEALTKSRVLPAHQNSYSGGVTSWFFSLASRIDIRLLLIGSLLPDIIDKPIGRVFFEDVFNNGRIFCHTLLFFIALVLIGIYLYWRHKKTWLLVLSFGTFTHLILDLMWLYPRTLLWPLYGLSFDKRAYINLGYWIRDIVDELLARPAVLLPELVGAAVIAWFVWLLVRRRKIRAFIRNGQV